LTILQARAYVIGDELRPVVGVFQGVRGGGRAFIGIERITSNRNNFGFSMPGPTLANW
jgi:hypothetical protein